MSDGFAQVPIHSYAGLKLLDYTPRINWILPEGYWVEIVFEEEEDAETEELD